MSIVVFHIVPPLGLIKLIIGWHTNAQPFTSFLYLFFLDWIFYSDPLQEITSRQYFFFFFVLLFSSFFFFLGTHSQTRTAGCTVQCNCPTFRHGNLTFALLFSVMRNDLHLTWFWIILHISQYLSNTELPGPDSVNPHLGYCSSFYDSTHGYC